MSDTAAGTTAVVGAPPDTALVAAADSAPVTPPAVDEYLRFAERSRAPDSAGVAGEGTSEGLRLLATAIEALAVRDTATIAAVRPRIEALRARADSAQQATDVRQQSRITSDALVLASELLQGLQQPGQPALIDRAAEARTAAASVRSDVPLADQADAVRRFFTRAAAALRGTVGAPTS